MATAEQRRLLVSKPCPWCHAAVGELCYTQVGGERRAITTLDGGCHDARWDAVFGPGGAAAVITAAVEAHHPIRERVDEAREPVSVGAAMPAVERPW